MKTDVTELLASAKRALAARDYAGARAVLEQVLAIDPRNVVAWLQVAGVRRQLNDLNGAFDALREVLRVDARNFHALLMSGSLLERDGKHNLAASSYGAALANVPPERHLDAASLQALQHARSVHSRYTRELSDFVRAEVAETQSQGAPSARRRVDSFIQTTLRLRKRYQQNPVEYFYPGLPSIEFYEREEFPWLPEFEAAAEDIRKDLLTLLHEDRGAFEPYIQYDDHLPLDQWRELNRSIKWTALHFYDRGKPIEERCRRASATMRAISKLPQAQVPLRSPTAFFSVLQARTHIPPHTGVANFRLVVHLPLMLPGGCRFRVGGEIREWKMGEAWVFDDTIEHEAWNDSDEARVILICDIWSPRLSEDERRAISEVIAAVDAFNGGPSARI
jgi:aspartyl/asparaginyl beta-hydroxylase (cupin superfamily)